MKKVLLQGSFDLLNYGHIRAFKDAKKQGDYLIVALNTDSLIRRYKKRDPILPYWQRKIVLKAIRYIDEVIPANDFNPLALLTGHDIKVYVCGEEWKETKRNEIKYMKFTGGKVYFTPEYPRVIHSSEMRKRMRGE